MPRKTTKITTSELLLSAVFYLQQKNGVTANEITKYICEKRGCAQKHIKDNVKKALERATVRGIFCKNRGLYRINNTFGLNKIIRETKRRGLKANKGTKAKRGGSEEKLKFQICWEEEKESEPMLLNEMVDKRMNNDHDNRSFYVMFPMSCDQDDDDDDDEDFKESDDDDDNDFFSDENGNNNSLHEISPRDSLTDPFRKQPGKEEYPEMTLSKEMLEERDCGEEINLGDRSEVIREESEGLSDYPSETGRYNGRSQFEDGYWDPDEQLERMNWDCQPNDLESLESLLEREKHLMNTTQRKHVGRDMARENTKKTKMQDNSRITDFTGNLPTDSFESSQTNESTR